MSTETQDATAKWAVYEANVQAYRRMSLTTQSILLAVGAIMYDKPPAIIGALSGLALLLTWWIFFRVIYSRTLIVDYFKRQIGLKYGLDSQQRVRKLTGNMAPITERQYVAMFSSIRKKVNAYISEHEMEDGHRFTNLRWTRIKMDIIVPGVLSLIGTGMTISKLVPGFLPAK